MAVIFLDTFTGSNGAGPPSPWIAVTLSGSQSIQSNKWHITNGTAYAGTAMTRGATTYTDLDITTDITLDATGAEQYPGIGARLSGGTNGWATFAEGNNGYVCHLEPLSDTVHLSIQTGGTNVSNTGAAATLTAGTTYKLRFQLIGTTIRCRVWDISVAEPATWAVSITDSTYTSGLVGFRDQSPSNIVTSDWDNFLVDNAPGGGGGTAITALADLGFAAAATVTRTTFLTAAMPLGFAATAQIDTPSAGGGAAVVAATTGR